MNQQKRNLYILLIVVLTGLSLYSSYDSLMRFRFMLFDIGNYYSESIFIFMMFSFLLSITGVPSLILNYKLTNSKNKIKESEIVDNGDLKGNNYIGKPLIYGYLLFGWLLIGLSVFMFIPLLQDYPLNEFPKGLLIYIIMVLIGVIGFFLIKDGLKINRIQHKLR